MGVERSSRFSIIAAALLSSQLLDDSSIHRLRNVNPLPATGSVTIRSTFTPLAGSVLFAAQDSANGWELWKSDGTAAGTRLVRDINPQGDSIPRFLTELGGRVYFFARADSFLDEQLWRTDGTTAGTELVTAIPFANGISSMVRIGTRLYFSAENPEPALWMSDGTAGGTIPVAGFTPDPAAFSYPPYGFVGYHDHIFFFATDSAGTGLWKTDGTAAGTTRVKDLGHALQPVGQPNDLVVA